MAKWFLKGVYRLGSYLIQVDDYTIYFESSTGRNYTGNPKFIYEELLKEGLGDKYTCVWSLVDLSTEIPGNPVKVKRPGFNYLYYSLKSKFWIYDSRHPQFFKKNKKTKYIQTWHGTPLKKLAMDMDKLNMSGDQDIEQYHENFRINTGKWDYLISQNSFSSETFRRAFDFKGEMLEIGYPRNDILVNENNEDKINSIKEKLGIVADKKIILYAPTWRDDEFYEQEKYKFATEMDFKAMENELSEDYILIVKFHYLVKDKLNWDSDFIIECDESWDIQELYLISDILITDYSSVMFDYAILRRPMLFFTYDLDNYKENLRDFYFDIHTVPGPLIKTNEELIKTIKELNMEDYEREYGQKYDEFQAKYNEFDKGTASKTIIDLIENST